MAQANRGQAKWPVIALLALCGCATVSATEPAVQDITINGKDVFPESVTSDAAGNVYVGSSEGTIYRAIPGSTTAEPWVKAQGFPYRLSSVFGVLADNSTGLLWVCSNNDFMKPDGGGTRTQLVAFTLKDGRFARSYDFDPGPAACNDIAVDRDDNVWVSETLGGQILVFRPSGPPELFASGPELVGIDGIAFASDGTLYINNVRKNLLQRVNRKADGSFAGLTTLTLSQPLNGPDGLRPIGGNRFLQAEGPGGRVAVVEVDGDRATITPVKTGLDSSPAVTRVGQIGYAPEGKIQYRMDPALRGKDPGPFVIRAFPLPAGL